MLGHLREVCEASGVGARIDVDAVPVLPGALDLLAEGMWAGGSQRNLDSVRPFVTTDLDISVWKHLADAQTSGGLLVALPTDRVGTYIEAVPGAERVGSIEAGSGIRIV